MKSAPIRSYNKSHLSEVLGPVETQYAIEMRCVGLENIVGYQVENVTNDVTYIVDVSDSLPSGGLFHFVGESKSGCISVSVKQGLVEIASFDVSTTEIDRQMQLDQLVDDATVTVRIAPGCSGGDNFGDLSFTIFCNTLPN